MTTNPYHEDPIVEQPAIGLFADIGWQMAWAQVSISKNSFTERTGHA
jgi:hypothetical protein